MNLFRYFVLFYFFISFYLPLSSCKAKEENNEPAIANSPGEMQKKLVPVLQQLLNRVSSPGFAIDSGVVLRQPEVVRFFYSQNGFEPFWCGRQKWLTAGDSLFQFIQQSPLFGLFPTDYHKDKIQQIRKDFEADTSATGARKNVSLWAKADILLTDAFIKTVSDIKLGRLPMTV